jgi:Flavoprotein
MESRALEASRVVATGPSAIGPKRKTRILLGVTGSVAAVKAPEIAVRLVQETDSHVKILLTKGGKNFWDKAKEYSLFWWEAYEKLAAGRAQDSDAMIQLICTSRDPSHLNQGISISCQVVSFLMNSFFIRFRR